MRPAAPGPPRPAEGDSSPLPPILYDGTEPFYDSEGRAVAALIDFWRWSSSNLLDNTLRGMLAEYLVGVALRCVTETHRTEWDAYDLMTSDGTKVEVKSSAYLQSWAQKTPSAIRFSIAERTGWDAATNTHAETAARQADVYVFCVFTETDRDRADPLDTRQWRFYVTPTTVLNAAGGSQKTIALSALRARVRPAEVGFDDLDGAVRNAATQKP